jgi:hypoxanthine phosphoribosyltransferase
MATPALHPAIETILVSEAAIQQRVRELGIELKRVYGEEELTVISIMNGAILRLDCIRISSYGNATESQGKPKLVHSLTLDVTGRHVLLLDDILDTGKTLALVSGMIRGLQPASLRVCVLLDKKGRRQVPFEADFTGFVIPDKFVVGYGLDYAERYRNLTSIGVLKPELQKTVH